MWFYYLLKKYQCASGELATSICPRRPTPRSILNHRLFGWQGAIKRLGAGDPIGADVVVIEQGFVNHHKPAHAVPAALHGTCNDRGALQGPWRPARTPPRMCSGARHRKGESCRRIHSPLFALCGARRAPEICPCVIAWHMQ
jgi:hypothetical protein